MLQKYSELGRSDDVDDARRLLVLNGSIEFSGKHHNKIFELKGVLPARARVFIPVLPNQSNEDRLSAMSSVCEAGFTPVPHIAATRVSSRDALRQFIGRAVSEYGVHEVLLIAGDLEVPEGPFQDSLSVIKDGILQDVGIDRVGLAGHPDKHPVVDTDTLTQALRDKLAIAQDVGLQPYIATQFTFDPKGMLRFCDRMYGEFPGVPVYVGMAGPTNLSKLLKYAKACGVNTSMKVAGKLGFRAASLLRQSGPERQLQMFARHRARSTNSNIAGIHIFSFGGLVDSANWMREQARID